MDVGFEPSQRLAEQSQAGPHGLVDERVLLLVGNDMWKNGADVRVRRTRLFSREGSPSRRGTHRRRGSAASALPIRSVGGRTPPIPATSARHGWPRSLVSRGLLSLSGKRSHDERAPVVVSARAGVSELVEGPRNALVLRDAQDVEVDSTIKRA
jgi:hypothetical protein